MMMMKRRRSKQRLFPNAALIFVTEVVCADCAVRAEVSIQVPYLIQGLITSAVSNDTIIW
jgi:hypothetical protein